MKRPGQACPPIKDSCGSAVVRTKRPGEVCPARKGCGRLAVAQRAMVGEACSAIQGGSARGHKRGTHERKLAEGWVREAERGTERGCEREMGRGGWEEGRRQHLGRHVNASGEDCLAEKDRGRSGAAQQESVLSVCYCNFYYCYY